MFRFCMRLANCWQSLRRTVAGPSKNSGRGRSHSRLALEVLESRLVPTVAWQGGAVLSSPDVQPVYLGSDWNTSAYRSQITYLNGFVSYLVQSSYLPMLGNAGYDAPQPGASPGSLGSQPIPIGKGTNETGQIDPVPLTKSQILTDAAIQGYLKAGIKNGTLKSPNSQNVYVVYVEDNVAVQSGGSNPGLSNVGLFAYHSAFAGANHAGQATDVHYAVIPYPGGSVGNLTHSWLGALSQTTADTSHELAEAVTDPNIGYKAEGWYDNQQGEVGEAGQPNGGQEVYLNGYVVQEIGDPNDQPMIPPGATSSPASVSFVLSSGTLSEYLSGNGFLVKTVATGVASLSDQGIDNEGKAMVDYVTTKGVAYQYDDGGAGYSLGNNVKSAVAGDGVSYVLFTNNVLKEFRDNLAVNGGNAWVTIDTLKAGATISAGADLHSVNTVYILEASGALWGVSDSPWNNNGNFENGNSDWFFVASQVKQASGGQQGNAAYLTTSGAVYAFHEGPANTPATDTLEKNLGAVSQITAGTDQNGNLMLDLVLGSGALMELDPSASPNWNSVANNVKSVSKGREGAIDFIFSSNGDCEAQSSAMGQIYLTNNATAAG